MPLAHNTVIEATQRSRDASNQANYLFTQHFLDHYARSVPWLFRHGSVLNFYGTGSRFLRPRHAMESSDELREIQLVSHFPIDAAIKAHFCLHAWLSPTPKKMRYEQMHFKVEFDENEVERYISDVRFTNLARTHSVISTNRVLKDVVKFLESLDGIALNNNLNVKAEELADTLENTIVVRLTEFPINEKTVEMFCHSLRGQTSHGESRPSNYGAGPVSYCP
ncbi:hypothetical protein GYMLUDRAFT_248014 [Collybiopsis luxurians FD-317 M1]|uniref:Uncharacterized protein n=1 Tax=Collybiopsis luxurians FD-317 M1 TaxID=944289 RepID=A0A0D0CDX2_9AGAR|nr:hypothetical protein GYMLUDRAFT_248014 [Collybiopsis luxurians FD-317 M1]